MYSAVYIRRSYRQPAAATRPVSSSSLMRAQCRTRSCRTRIWHCIRDCLSHRHAAETVTCMPLYTPRRLDTSRRSIVSRPTVVSLRYQRVAHPDPLSPSVQPLPAHLVLIECHTEIVVDVLPIDSRNRLLRR